MFTLCKTLREKYNAVVWKNNYGGRPTSGWTGQYTMYGAEQHHDISDFLNEEQANRYFNKYLIELIEANDDDDDDYDDDDYDDEDDDFYD